MELVIRKRDKIFTIVVVVILALYGYYAFLRLPLTKKVGDMEATFEREGSIEEVRARGDALLGRLDVSQAELSSLEALVGDECSKLRKISLQDFGDRVLQCGLVLESLSQDDEAGNYRVTLCGSWADFCALLTKFREDDVICRIRGLNFNGSNKRWEFLLWL